MIKWILLLKIHYSTYIIYTISTHFNVGLLNKTDPEFIMVGRKRTQQFSILTHWQSIIYYHLTAQPYHTKQQYKPYTQGYLSFATIQIQTHKVFPTRVDDWFTFSILRVDTPT